MPSLRQCLLLCLLAAAMGYGQRRQPLRIGAAGAEPFVVREGNAREGIAIEVWEAVAARAGWQYEFQDYGNGPEAIQALRDGTVDAAVGPITITAERAGFALFSQPFFSSHIAIVSRTEAPSLFRRLAPFFTRSFFWAVVSLLAILALVGTLIWLAERRAPDAHFAQEPLRGIGSGIWFAIVTMSTVGYGDLSPRTVLGRTVTATWIVISVIAATSLVAGIASTLTLSGINVDTIATADQLRGRPVAVLANSPNEGFVSRHGARVREVDSLPEAFQLLENESVDAIVSDRPQLQYFVKQRNPPRVAISAAEYEQQDYGFAFAPDSTLVREFNIHLLEMRESGALARVVERWLGSSAR